MEKLEDLILELVKEKWDIDDELSSCCGPGLGEWKNASEKEKQAYIDEMTKHCERIRAAI